MRWQHLPWTFVLRDGEDKGGGGGGGDPAAAFAASLPESIRSHESLKGIGDLNTLATRYVERSTPKPFAEQLPEKIRGEAAFKDIKSLDALADSYYNAQKLLGVPKDQILRLPTSDKPEDWAPVYDKLGRPTKPEEYKFTLKDGQKIEPEFQKSLTAKAHELGVSNKALDGLTSWFLETAGAASAAEQAKQNSEVSAASQALKTEWGQAYDAKINDGIAVVDFLDKNYPGLKANLDASKLGNNPSLAKFFADYATMLREDGKLTGRASGSSGLQSPAEAQQSIAALQQDKTFMATYMNRSAPGHKEAVQRMQALYELAHPAAA